LSYARLWSAMRLTNEYKQNNRTQNPVVRRPKT